MIQTVNDKPVIFGGGCFDVLHVGHYRYLNFCKEVYKALGSKLVISLDSDKKIRAGKGHNRPIFSEGERKDAIWLLLHDIWDDLIIEIHHSDEDLAEAIKKYKPILVESKRWKNKVVGEHFAQGIIYFNEICTSSSTDIIQRILDKYR